MSRERKRTRTNEDKTMKTNKTVEAARKFTAAARSAGWSISTREGVVSISKRFTPGSREQFIELDSEYYDVLSMVTARGGSMWGTDGSGVGGYAAMQSGVFTMNISGVSAAFIAAI